MRKTRLCASALLNTGVSKCQIDFDKVKGAIIVERGQKLPSSLTATALETMCHADRPGRAYPVMTFVEYAKNGGEPQVGATGYGPQGVTGISPLTETFTLDKFYEALNSALLKSVNYPFDVYFFDAQNIIYGINDGTDVLAGIPMSTIYPTATPHPTSSAKAQLTVSFCYEDVKKAMEDYDYIQADFNVKSALMPLTPVELVGTGSNKYKLIESIGGYDRTDEFGSLIQSGASSIFESGVTAASYANGEITITGEGSVSVKAPSVLYTNDIKGIEVVKVVPSA